MELGSEAERRSAATAMELRPQVRAQIELGTRKKANLIYCEVLITCRIWGKISTITNWRMARMAKIMPAIANPILVGACPAFPILLATIIPRIRAKTIKMATTNTSPTLNSVNILPKTRTMLAPTPVHNAGLPESKRPAHGKAAAKSSLYPQFRQTLPKDEFFGPSFHL